MEDVLSRPKPVPPKRHREDKQLCRMKNETLIRKLLKRMNTTKRMKQREQKAYTLTGTLPSPLKLETLVGITTQAIDAPQLETPELSESDWEEVHPPDEASTWRERLLHWFIQSFGK